MEKYWFGQETVAVKMVYKSVDDDKEYSEVVPNQWAGQDYSHLPDEQRARAVIDWYNSTLRDGEVKREFVRLENENS